MPLKKHSYFIFFIREFKRASKYLWFLKICICQNYFSGIEQLIQLSLELFIFNLLQMSNVLY